MRTAPSIFPSPSAAVALRPIEPADAGAAARIVFEAFAGIHDRHDFPRDFPTIEAAEQLVEAFTAHPSIWGVVAERDGRVIGSNFLDERGSVRGVGPITVDPAIQEAGVGRALMAAVLDRGATASGVRLLQDAFNGRSMALYASLGFDTREPVALLGGRPRAGTGSDLAVRPLEPRDVAACDELHRRVHGFERGNEIADALSTPGIEPVVGERGGRVVAYATGVTFFAASHGVGETEADLGALILGALERGDAPASILLPTRQPALFRALLSAGLRVMKPMTYMTTGEYRPPAGAWFPTVLY